MGLEPIICFFCQEEITRFDGKGSDSHILHHKDGNPQNWRISNLANSHKKCHQSNHARAWWSSLPISEKKKRIESAKEHLATFIVNNKGFFKGRKLSEETKRKISMVKKEKWSRISKEERRKSMRRCWEASPMNKKGRPPTMKIIKRDNVGRIVEAIAIS